MLLRTIKKHAESDRNYRIIRKNARMQLRNARIIYKSPCNVHAREHLVHISQIIAQ